MTKPIVAIVGRPNVGKSTIFNRVVGERVSIVEDTPGVTRDRIYSSGEWLTHDFNIIDTGGIEIGDAPFQTQIRAQAEVAIDEADVIIFMVNVREGLTQSDEIHTARNVTKTHTSNTNTFQSPNHGPLGVVTKNSVQFHHKPYEHLILNEIDHTLNIPLVKAYMGMNSDVLTFHSDNNVDGIIIEALGQGNLPPTSLEGLDKCLDKNIPIILVSRSFNGIVGPIYAYEGGGATLTDKGVIFSNGLNGPKARLKLLVGLSNDLTFKQLKRYFESQL